MRVTKLWATATACVMLTGLIATPAMAAPEKVSSAPTALNVNTWWGGMQEGDACPQTDAPVVDPNALPDGLTCAEPAPSMDLVTFKVERRKIVDLDFDIELQCLSSPVEGAPSGWQGVLMSWRTNDFTYVGLDGRNTIGPDGKLRLQFEVPQNIGYPPGTVQVTINLKARGSKVSIYYSGGRDDEDGGWERCYSQGNRPTVLEVKKMRGMPAS